MSQLEEVCVDEDEPLPAAAEVAGDESLPVAADEPSPPEQAVLDLDCPVAAPVDLESVTVFVESPASPEGWVCSECTLHNETGAQFCDACDEPAPASAQKSIIAVNVPITALPAGGWSCAKCTLVNPLDGHWCTACEERRPVESYRHPRSAGLPREVLASHAYLDLLLFAYAESEVRAKTHGRYQMVCKAWQVK